MTWYRYYNKIYDLKDMYHIEQVTKEFDNSNEYIKRLEDEIQLIKKHQLKLYEKYNELYNANYTEVIILRKIERKRIEYQIFYCKTYKNYNHSNYNHWSLTKDYKSFFGTERKEAFNYADKLSKKYNCKIEKNF